MSSLIALIGRICLSSIFLISTPSHFSREGIAYAASQGVPLSFLLTPLAGLLALAGSVSLLIGYKAREGAWLLVLFLIPVTLIMHAFWNVSDPTAAELQRIMFLKNLSILGGVLFVAAFGAGRLSVDGWRVSRKSSEIHHSGE